MRRVTLLVTGLALLTILAGCTGFQGTLDHQLTEDPAADQVGWENGYWYDESLAVTTEDGLNASEREAVLARTMARVEQVRELEFESAVTLEVISRTEYRNRSVGLGVEENPWNEQVWEALLLVGEDRTVDSAFGQTFNSSVQGYYAPGNDSIVIVSDSETPTVDRATLAHELVHALQDQHGGLDGSPATQDRQLASQAVTEGEANYVQQLYERRCENEWRCLERPTSSPSSGGRADDGVFLTIYQPYATGPGFIAQVRNEGGWDAVGELYDSPPNSTEQVIHPEKYPDEEPVDVTVEDRSSGKWSRFDHDPVADTVGEASIYATLSIHGEVENADGNPYGYQSKSSAGWGGDSVVPYHNSSTGTNQTGESEAYGYVWKLEWGSERDAREFENAYRSILADSANSSADQDVFVVPESDTYGDAFHVSRDGTTVTIVNAPTRSKLSEIHAPAGV